MSCTYRDFCKALCGIIRKTFSWSSSPLDKSCRKFVYGSSRTSWTVSIFPVVSNLSKVNISEFRHKTDFCSLMIYKRLGLSEAFYISHWRKIACIILAEIYSLAVQQISTTEEFAIYLCTIFQILKSSTHHAVKTYLLLGYSVSQELCSVTAESMQLLVELIVHFKEYAWVQ